MSKELTEQQKIFLEVYFQECYINGHRKQAGNIAKQAAGYSENTNTHLILASVKDALVERCTHELAAILPKALSELERIMEDPSAKIGSDRALKAALELLDRAGLTKKEQSEVTIKQPEGLIVIPPKKKEE